MKTIDGGARGMSAHRHLMPRESPSSSAASAFAWEASVRPDEKLVLLAAAAGYRSLARIAQVTGFPVAKVDRLVNELADAEWLQLMWEESL